MKHNTPKGRIRLYACGGGGINIAKQLERLRDQPDAGFGLLDIAYLDTSKSNAHVGVPEQFSYILKGKDGSGKVRRENHLEIANNVLAILQQFAPGDLNIVLTTGGGGSGSVFAPLLVGELLSNACPTVVIAIGCVDNRADVENTLNTLKSFEAKSQKQQMPIVVAYLQNVHGKPRSDTDKKATSIILSLCVLFSRENRELDTMDLVNWLRFDKVTSFEPQVASLTIFDKKTPIDLSLVGNVISVASLAEDEDKAGFPMVPDYRCMGLIPEAAVEVIADKMPMHFIVSDGIVPDAIESVSQMLTDLNKAQNARVKRVRILSDSDVIDDTGLVL